jgi:hypothetical protein
MSFLSSIFAPGEQERGDELDAKLAALNQQEYANGKISATELARRDQEQADNAVNVDESLNDAFVEGAKEGYNATTGAIKTGLAAPFKFTWAILPWQVYAVAAVALFLYMGGGIYLKGLLPRKLK